VERHDRVDAEIIGGVVDVDREPAAASVDSGVDGLGVGDKVSAFGSVAVHVEGVEAFAWDGLLPGVAFVAGLPEAAVIKANKNGLLRTVSD